MFGIGLMILLAQPAFAEELGQANITPRTKMAEIRSNPSIVGAGIYTYSLDQDRALDRLYWDAQPLSRLSAPGTMTCYEHEQHSPVNDFEQHNRRHLLL